MNPLLALKARTLVVVPLRDGSSFRVAGDSGTYTVRQHETQLVCDCLAGNKLHCSHRVAVQFHSTAKPQESNL